MWNAWNTNPILVRPESRARCFVERSEHRAIDRNAALVRIVESGQNVQKGRFTDPGLADDRNELARPDIEIEAAEQTPRSRDRFARARAPIGEGTT